MKKMNSTCRMLSFAICILLLSPGVSRSEEDPQYELGEFSIPAAGEKEPYQKELSVAEALKYVEVGAASWSRNRKCISCHTNGTYLFIRPSLTKELGQPSGDIRDFFVSHMKELKSRPMEKIKVRNYPGEVIYLAAGLAEWDKHLNKKTSPETEEALEFMFSVQMENGSWDSETCWPPFESSSYQLATMAAMACGTAPGWIEQQGDLTDNINLMKKYLTSTSPPHDYGKMLLLWASTRMPELIDAEKKKEIIELIWSMQHFDGGWAIRDFAKPEEWGNGARAEKIKKEPDFSNPESDGHQTGLAVVVLRDAGVPETDPRIQKALTWIKNNQRLSGRWWTRSLNTDGSHYITYSATCYSLLALSRCHQLPQVNNEQQPVSILFRKD